MSDRLEEILKYEMTKDEALAFKAALIWEQITQDECPGERCGRLSAKGDPRKSNLFRHCHKMITDTKGLLDVKEIKNYIKAQVQVMKSITDGRSHADVAPQILAGPKAWTRWKMWQARHNRDMAKPVSVEQLEISVDDSKVIAELERTKQHFAKMGVPVAEIERNTMIRWVRLGKVSPYWVILDERLDDYCKQFDRTLYDKDISASVKQWFGENNARI